MRFSRTQPECQFGNLHTLFVNIHSIKIVLQNAVFHILEHNRASCNFGFHLVNEFVLINKKSQCRIEESTRTASRVANSDSEQPLAICLQFFHQSFLGCHLAVFVRKILRFINSHFGFLLCAQPPNGIFNDVFGDILRCIENPVTLSFRNRRRLFATIDLRRHLFYLIERVLKNMSEDIHIHLACVVIFG